MDILTYHRQGMSQRKIAWKLGISRNTVKRYIDKPEFPESLIGKRRKTRLLDPFEGNIKSWLKEDMQYTARWIYDRLRAMGFNGSYEIVKRKVGGIKAEQQKVAYMRFETEPGYQGQVDFGEFQVENADGSIKKLYLFSMILGYSREIYGELVERCDLAGFLDCHMRAFDHFGGVPEQILYDRMKNVFIGKVAGRNRFNGTLMGFALHYGFKPEVAPAYAAWVKGKIERPYTFIREGFWRGYGFVCIETANRDLKDWLKKKSERVHGTTHEVVCERFAREAPHLKVLPFKVFDTSYRICRRVQKDCTVRFEGNSYVIPHRFVDKQVVLRVKDRTMRIFADDRLIVTYEIPRAKGQLVQDKRFYEELKKDREMNKRKYGHSQRIKGRAKNTISPLKPPYDMEVEIRPIAIYDHAAWEAWS